MRTCQWERDAAELLILFLLLFISLPGEESVVQVPRGTERRETPVRQGALSDYAACFGPGPTAVRWRVGDE